MRLFVAIDINDEALEAISALQRNLKSQLKNGNGLKWVDPKLMHLTLKFLGEVDQAKVDEIGNNIEKACSEISSFKFELSVVDTFGKPVKVLWLGCEKENAELVKLYTVVENALEMLGFQKESRPFSAHLTLARIKDRCTVKNLRQIVDSYSKVEIPPIPVNLLGIYKSQLTSDGPVYTLLRKIELK